jgi:hypothetical protein
MGAMDNVNLTKVKQTSYASTLNSKQKASRKRKNNAAKAARKITNKAK